MSFHRLFPDDFEFSFNPFSLFKNNAESYENESFTSTSIINGKRITHSKNTYKDSTGLEKVEEYRNLGDGRVMRFTSNNSNGTQEIHTSLEGVDSSTSFNKAWKKLESDERLKKHFKYEEDEIVVFKMEGQGYSEAKVLDKFILEDKNYYTLEILRKNQWPIYPYMLYKIAEEQLNKFNEIFPEDYTPNYSDRKSHLEVSNKLTQKPSGFKYKIGDIVGMKCKNEGISYRVKVIDYIFKCPLTSHNKRMYEVSLMCLDVIPSKGRTYDVSEECLYDLVNIKLEIEEKPKKMKLKKLESKKMKLEAELEKLEKEKAKLKAKISKTKKKLRKNKE